MEKHAVMTHMIISLFTMHTNGKIFTLLTATGVFCYKVSCQFRSKEILITTVTFGSVRRIGIFLANSENNFIFFWYICQKTYYILFAVFTDSIVPYLLPIIFYIFTVYQISNKISVIPRCPLNYLNIRQWPHEKFLQLRCIRWLSAVAWGDQTNIGFSLEETESLPWSLGQ